MPVPFAAPAVAVIVLVLIVLVDSAVGELRAFHPFSINKKTERRERWKYSGVHFHNDGEKLHNDGCEGEDFTFTAPRQKGWSKHV